MTGKLVIGLILIGLIAMPSAAAQKVTVTGGTASSITCRAWTVATVAAQNGAGDIVFCTSQGFVATSTQTLIISASLTTPPLSGAGAGLSISLLELKGCTASAFPLIGPTATQAAGAEISRAWNITMHSQQCVGYMRGIVNAGAGGAVIADLYLPVNILSNDAITRVDNYERFCDDGQFGDPCAPVNWISQAIVFFGPLLLFIGLGVWAEMSREWLIYLLAILAGSVAVISLPVQLIGMQFIIVASIVLLALRGAMEYRSLQIERENAE